MRALLRKLALVVLFVVLVLVAIRVIAGLSTTPVVPPSASTATIPAKPTPTGGGTGRIAFATHHDDKYQIYMIKSDGTGLIHVTDTLTEPQSLQWSHDGKLLAFRLIRFESEI